MHWSFVTTAHTGTGNSRDFDFCLCKARIYSQQYGDIFMVNVLTKPLPKSQQVNVKLLRPVWVWIKSPAVPWHFGDDDAQNMALKASYIPAIHGPIEAKLTNDWCINHDFNKRKRCYVKWRIAHTLITYFTLVNIGFPWCVTIIAISQSRVIDVVWNDSLGCLSM